MDKKSPHIENLTKTGQCSYLLYCSESYVQFCIAGLNRVNTCACTCTTFPPYQRHHYINPIQSKTTIASTFSFSC